MARHPRPPSPSPPPAPAPSDPDAGFDPVEEWLLDFDQAMASELAKSFGIGEEAEAAAAVVPDDAREPTGCDFGVPVSEDGSVSGSGGFGAKPVVKEEVVEEKDELLGMFGDPSGGEFGGQKEAVMLGGGLGEQLGSDQLPLLGISDLAVKGDVLEGVVGAEMSNLAAVDAEMSSEVLVKEVVEGGSGKGEEETKDEELESNDDEEDEESSEASSSSDEEEQRAKKDEESSEASSSSDEEEQSAKKHGAVADMEALIEEGELMVGIDDDDEEAPKGPIKSKHEVEVLPPVPKIEVQLEPHHKALPVGIVSAIMGERVIVEGSAEHSPLNEGSILWITESRAPLGIVDELFGPVKNPYYLVRYNSAEEVPSGISAGTAVSFVAEFADHILNIKELYAKGYDESGDHDEEQTDEPEFSDDEEEAEYKRSLRLAKRPTDRQHESKKPSGDKKRAQPRGAGLRKDMPPRTHDAPAPGHRSQHHFHRPDMAPAVANSATRPSGSQNFPMSAPTMLPPISMNHAMPSAVQLANQMGGCFINPSQQFSPQQPNVVWPGGLPPQLHPNMGVDAAAFAANIMQSILIGANQYQQHFQNQNFGGFPNGMPVPPSQFMPGSGMPANPMPFGGPPVNHPFGPASQLPIGQGSFGQLPHMAGNQGQPPAFPLMQGFGRPPSPQGDGDQPPGFPNMQGYGRLPSPQGDGDQPPGFPNMQGYGRLPSPHGDGDQPPMQFNSGQFNQGNSSFRGRRPQQRGGRHSPGRGGGSRHSPGRGGGSRHSPGRGAGGRHCK